MDETKKTSKRLLKFIIARKFFERRSWSKGCSARKQMSRYGDLRSILATFIVKKQRIKGRQWYRVEPKCCPVMLQWTLPVPVDVRRRSEFLVDYKLSKLLVPVNGRVALRSPHLTECNFGDTIFGPPLDQVKSLSTVFALPGCPVMVLVQVTGV